MDWTIEYYETPGGKCPVKEFIDSLSHESKAKYIFIADLLEEYGIGVKEAEGLSYCMALQKRRKRLP